MHKQIQNKMKRLTTTTIGAALTMLAFCFSTTTTAQDKSAFWLGADISGTSGLEKWGIPLYDAQGIPCENTALMKSYGLNAAGYRVWVNPNDGWCNKEDVLVKALRAKQQGMDIMIDFHYSDWWADPAKQNIPAAWAKHKYKQLLVDVANHTKEVLTMLKDNGIT